uniref:Uncharacterized protein n=1 Tax=Oryza nivara TaxID=4536 RepID=A0A0E0HYG0_ORYNI
MGRRRQSSSSSSGSWSSRSGAEATDGERRTGRRWQSSSSGGRRRQIWPLSPSLSLPWKVAAATPEAADPAPPWPDLAPRRMEWRRPRRIETVVVPAVAASTMAPSFFTALADAAPSSPSLLLSDSEQPHRGDGGGISGGCIDDGAVAFFTALATSLLALPSSLRRQAAPSPRP